MMKAKVISARHNNNGKPVYILYIGENSGFIHFDERP